jgi:septum site-determining protein MinC
MKQINPSSETPFELKGSVLTIIVLHIKETDEGRLYPHLEKKIGQSRSFFNNAPVLIDLSKVEEESQLALDFVFLVKTLRRWGLVPVGVRGSAECLTERVLQAGLGLLPVINTEKSVESDADKQYAKPKSLKENPPSDSSDMVSGQVPAVAPTKVVTHPVRSGQQVFAPSGDLVVLSSVNAGAEVLAAGNIHIYGSLRGRAMAGINGDKTARIYSMQCNPELVSVAGEYMVNELLDTTLINQSVIISNEDGSLKFEIIGSFNPFS